MTLHQEYIEFYELFTKSQIKGIVEIFSVMMLTMSWNGYLYLVSVVYENWVHLVDT